MSAGVDLAPETSAAAPAAAAPGSAGWRTFAWSVRRELWEHRAILMAPLAVAAFAVFVHFATALLGNGAERLAVINDPARAPAFDGAYDAVTGIIVITGLLVGALYCLDALYGERRDRSILFWKSLPVSDRTTVLAKAATPLLVLPLTVFALAIAANLAMVVLQSLAWSVRGFDPRDLWARLDIPFRLLSLAYGLPFMALWYAPIFAWLLFASAWSRRLPFLWGFAPLAAVLIVEHTALHMTSAHWMTERYLAGGVVQPYTRGGDGQTWVQRLSDLEPVRLYTQPGLWIGFAIAALLLWATIRVRRSRGPI